jgi:superkiller protein 3
VLVLSGGCRALDGMSRPRDTQRSELAPGQPTEEQQARLTEAQAAKEAGNYDLALSMFQDILAENPTIVTGYLGIGEVFMLKHDYGRAESAYRQSAKLAPRNFDAQLGHGLALHMLERYEDAVKAFHRALTIDPDDVRANLSLATTYLSMNKARSAMLYAERVVQLDPNNGAARTNLGAIYEILGRNQEAIDQYLAAAELLPASPQLMLNLLNVLAKEKRYQEVINTAETLVKIEDSANAYERMAYAYFRLRDYDRSLRSYQSAVEIDENHWQSWNGIGVNEINRWLLSKKQDRQAATRARDAFRRSLRINAEQPKVIELLSNHQL